MSFHDIKIGDECFDIKSMLPSAEPTGMLCKLLRSSQLQISTWNVLMVMFLSNHYFMALFGVAESKIEDPRGRLTRLKYTFRDGRDV